jgi:hypothetical protein
MKRRVNALEQANRTSDGTLVFKDGSTRSIKISRRNRLRLFIDAMQLAWFHLPVGPGGPPGPKVKPTIEHESAIRLIGGAERVETNDKFLRLTQEVCAEALQKEREARDENAPTLHDEK